MICPRCSNECEDNLLFCPKCGYKVNTFIQNDSQKKTVTDDAIDEMIIGHTVTEDVEAVEAYINKENKSDNIKTENRVKKEFFDEDDEDLDDYLSSRQIRDIKKTTVKKSESKPVKKQEMYKSTKSKKKPKSRKKKIFLVVIVAILSVVLAVGITYFVKKSSMEKKFNKYYNQGDVYFAQQNYKEAKTQFVNAASNAFTREQKIKSYEMIYQIDAILGNYIDEEIKYLELLIDVDPDNIDYYKALIVLYQNNGMEDEIAPLINKAPTNIKESLESFDGTIPVASVEEGSYDKPIDVQLSTMEGLSIYYTLTESGGTENPIETEYKKPIVIDEEGNYTLKAYSTSDSGNNSKELVVRYNINFNEVEEPKISLDTGHYYEEETITVTAEKGCTIYYTTTGDIPTNKSEKYKKPIELPEGDSLYYFVAINKDGVSSDVVTRAYTLQPKYEVDYDTALSTLSLTLVSNGILENKYGEFENGDVAYFEYNSIEDIDESKYYIITCEIETKVGVTKSTEIYAVSCESGECYKAIKESTGYSIEEL